MKKLLLGIAGFVLVVIAGSLWWVYNSLDAQIASAIRRYGPEISGIPVSLSGVSISLVDDSASLHGLVVGNPDGYIKYGTASVSAEVLRGDVLSVPLPDLHLQDIGKKSNGTTAGEAMRQILVPFVQQVGTAVVSRGVKATGKTIQQGVEAATQMIKGLMK